MYHSNMEGDDMPSIPKRMTCEHCNGALTIAASWVEYSQNNVWINMKCGICDKTKNHNFSVDEFAAFLESRYDRKEQS